MKRRAINVQGLADTFMKLRMPFDSEAAAKLNREIFETIYFAALTASKVLARACGRGGGKRAAREVDGWL